MKFTPTAIPDVILVEAERREDERGFFMETYQARVFAAAGIVASFVQDNHSGSGQGVLRGLHYQIRQAQGKIVRVVAGEVFDVAVDLRRSSPHYGKWVGGTLSAENHTGMWIPPGFAHGFYVLSAWAEVIYKVTQDYAPGWERTLVWSDPVVGIEWPLLEGQAPRLSPKDAAGKTLAEAEVFE